MSETYTTCPQCEAMLLADTPQCPSCHYVIDPERVDDIPKNPLPSNPEGHKLEEPCANCGEMVRIGLVRCWNCGSFMHAHIEESYQRMQEGPQPVIYSPLPGKNKPVSPGGSDLTSADDPSAEEPGSGEFDVRAEDRDFELSANSSSPQIGESDFEVDPDLSARVKLESPTPTPATRSAATSAGPDRAGRPSVPDASSAGGTLSGSAETPAERDPNEESSTYQLSSGEGAPPSDSPTDSPKATQPPGETGDEQPHSVATGGDLLLQVALQEEAEIGRSKSASSSDAAGRKPRKGKSGRKGGGSQILRTKSGGILMHCPWGHRVEVQEKHRGLAGRCPKCKAMFIVPEVFPWELKTDAAQQASADTGQSADAAQPSGAPGAAAQPPLSAGQYQRWLTDVRLHTVNPQKLKLKPDSLLKEFEEVDLGFAAGGLLLVRLVGKGGLFGPKKKKEPTRDEVFAHLTEDKPLADLPADWSRLYDPDALGRLRVVQPVVDEHASAFAGIEVFGTGRIAVGLPKLGDDPHPQYLSFYLSEFRRFVEFLREFCGVGEFLHDAPVPLEETFEELSCHFTEATLKVLQQVLFYEADPAFNVELAGWKCQSCGIVVSEDARRKEKIGGLKPKGLAKVKCPKCGGKFGEQPFHTLSANQPAPPPSLSAPKPDESQSAQAPAKTPPAETSSAETRPADAPQSPRPAKKPADDPKPKPDESTTAKATTADAKTADAKTADAKTAETAGEEAKSDAPEQADSPSADGNREQKSENEKESAPKGSDKKSGLFGKLFKRKT